MARCCKQVEALEGTEVPPEVTVLAKWYCGAVRCCPRDHPVGSHRWHSQG